MKCPYKHRLFILDDLPTNSICAEIGVYKGNFSQYILKICEPEMLHLIDPYFQFPLVNLEGNFSIHEKRFEDTNFKNDYFDWVYLDTDHGFMSTYRQLELCYKKVKKDGFITGDDCSEYYKLLKLALNMFLKKYKNKVELEYIKNYQYKIRKIK